LSDASRRSQDSTGASSSPEAEFALFAAWSTVLRARGIGMGLISLRDEQKVNVPEIDAQHEALVELINQLHQAMSDGRGKEVLGRVISALVDHTRSHFAYEEQLMTEHAFPGFDKHREEHDRLLQHIEELARRFDNGDLLLSFAVMVDLRAWALVHIEKFDIALGAFLNRRTDAGR
jgi:hemerythrin